MRAVARIRKFVSRRKAAESCHLCGIALGQRHPHLYESAPARVRCTCAGCASVFGHGSGKFRRLPERVVRLEEFPLTAEQWAACGIPVGIAYFLRRGESALALYPSPLGAIESTVPEDAWESMIAANGLLRSMEPDVEALLVGRSGTIRGAYIVPIDECHRLVGILRREWQGFTGGDRVQAALEEFFAELRTRSGGGP
jgi:hypothetical protein